MLIFVLSDFFSSFQFFLHLNCPICFPDENIKKLGIDTLNSRIEHAFTAVVIFSVQKTLHLLLEG